MKEAAEQARANFLKNTGLIKRRALLNPEVEVKPQVKLSIRKQRISLTRRSVGGIEALGISAFTNRGKLSINPAKF